MNNTTTADELEDVMWIAEAAKAVGMRRERVLALAIEHKLAIPWGGTKKHPRLKVKLSELKRLLVSRRYVEVEGHGRIISTAERRAVRPGIHCDVTC
jgi:hypothetical protein